MSGVTTGTLTALTLCPRALLGFDGRLRAAALDPGELFSGQQPDRLSMKSQFPGLFSFHSNTSWQLDVNAGALYARMEEPERL